MPTNITRYRKSIVIIGILALLLSSGAWFVVEKLPWVSEYHERPPQQIFREVLGQPVSAGVSKLRVVARQFFIKRWVWMRFEATEAALQKLTAKLEPVETVNWPRALKGQSWVANSKNTATDQNLVGWDEVKTIEKPEIYVFYSSAENFLWQGNLIVNRKTRTVYLHAGGD